MNRLSLFFALILCTSCQIGLIPCPKVKHVRQRHVTIYSTDRNRNQMSSSARVHSRYYRGPADHMIENTTVEDWDCPKPGQKKYMPRAVKDNIRKNLKKVADDERQNSVQVKQ